MDMKLAQLVSNTADSIHNIEKSKARIINNPPDSEADKLEMLADLEKQKATLQKVLVDQQTALRAEIDQTVEAALEGYQPK